MFTRGLSYIVYLAVSLRGQTKGIVLRLSNEKYISSSPFPPSPHPQALQPGTNFNASELVY